MDFFYVDTVVAGAGVVGLAVARALALAGHEVLIVEKNPLVGEETSARNSEVIHAGIYYAEDSLKAQHCVRGREMLYAYCRERGVSLRQYGKLIVATSASETNLLPEIHARALANGVDDLHLIGEAETKALEPALRATAALHSPSTGVVDSHGLMLAMLGDAESHGTQLALRSTIMGGVLNDDGSIDLIIGGVEPAHLRARSFVNCAGLWAPGLSSRIRGLPPPPELALVKGSYFSYPRPAPFSHLIYPVPSDGGLGVHLTLDLAGRARFGPDTEWLMSNAPEAIDYKVSPDNREEFARAIKQYWPDIIAADLVPDYAGVRPKIAGTAYPDFQILGPEALPGAHAMLYGIESPGLTAALSIAEEVASRLS